MQQPGPPSSTTTSEPRPRRSRRAPRARACSGRAAVEAGRLSLPTGLLLDEGSARLTIGKGLCLLAVPNVETGQPLGAADPQPVDPGTA